MAVRRSRADTAASLGFEARLWQAADALRSNMDAAEYKHVVLGLVFLKYVSDAFEEYHADLEGQRGEGADPEDSDEYRAVNIFWMPLAPTGLAGFVLANGSMSSNQSGEGEIRRNIVEADLVDCMVALPGQLFYSTQIPACLWFLARDKRNDPRSTGSGQGFRDRRGETLFIDARKLGTMIDRTHRELAGEDIARIARIYHAWRGEGAASEYADVAGFCKSAPLEEVRKHGYALTPGRYVGAGAAEDDGEPFDEKMRRLTATLRDQQIEAEILDAAIATNLRKLGYGG